MSGVCSAYSCWSNDHACPPCESHVFVILEAPADCAIAFALLPLFKLLQQAKIAWNFNSWNSRSRIWVLLMFLLLRNPIKPTLNWFCWQYYVCLCVWLKPDMACSSVLWTSAIKNTSIRHGVARGDMFLHHDEHGHCNLFRVDPTAASCCRLILNVVLTCCWEAKLSVNTPFPPLWIALAKIYSSWELNELLIKRESIYLDS